VRVVQDYVGRQTLDDPRVLKALVWRHALLRVPFETVANEIDEVRIWQLSKLVHDVTQSLFFLLLVQHFKRGRNRIIFKLREQLLPL